MNRAVLVLDKFPESCNHCVFLQVGFDFGAAICKFCGLMADAETFWSGKEIPRSSKCPLRELPDYRWCGDDDEYDFGWDDCLCAIIGEGV